MESLNLQKGYGKLNNLEDQPQSQKPGRKCQITTISILAILLLTILIGFMLLALVHESRTESPGEEPEEAIKAVCKLTPYPESCFTSISSLNSKTPTMLKLDPEVIFNLSVIVSINQLNNLSSSFKDLHSQNAAVSDCLSLLDDALNWLADSVNVMKGKDDDEVVLTKDNINDIKTWISAAMTDQETCGDGLEDTGSMAVIDDQVKEMMKKSDEDLSNSLAILANVLQN